MTRPAPDFLVAVVDDDRSIRESLEDLLESAGYAVRIYSSASALLQSGDLAEIACLISDIQMSPIDGFELLKRARKEKPGLPVILITGRDDAWNLSRGHCLLFAKPFDGQQMLEAVNDAVRRARQNSGQRVTSAAS